MSSPRFAARRDRPRKRLSSCSSASRSGAATGACVGGIDVDANGAAAGAVRPETMNQFLLNCVPQAFRCFSRLHVGPGPNEAEHGALLVPPHHIGVASEAGQNIHNLSRRRFACRSAGEGKEQQHKGFFEAVRSLSLACEGSPEECLVDQVVRRRYPAGEANWTRRRVYARCTLIRGATTTRDEIGSRARTDMASRLAPAATPQHPHAGPQIDVRNSRPQCASQPSRHPLTDISRRRRRLCQRGGGYAAVAVPADEVGFADRRTKRREEGSSHAGCEADAPTWTRSYAHQDQQQGSGGTRRPPTLDGEEMMERRLVVCLTSCAAVECRVSGN